MSGSAHIPVLCGECKIPCRVYSLEFLSCRPRTEGQESTAEADVGETWTHPYHLTPSGEKCKLPSTDAYENSVHSFFSNSSLNVETLQDRTIRLAYGRFCPTCAKLIYGTWLRPVDASETPTHMKMDFRCPNHRRSPDKKHSVVTETIKKSSIVLGSSNTPNEMRIVFGRPAASS